MIATEMIIPKMDNEAIAEPGVKWCEQVSRRTTSAGFSAVRQEFWFFGARLGDDKGR
jgi:hypothetical protein